LDRARAARESDPVRATELLRAADARLAALEQPNAAGDPPARRSFELQVAIRLVRARPPEPPRVPSLVVAHDGRYFRAPRGRRADLGRSPVLRSLLLALARARRERPGTPCTRASLVQACWPGMKMSPRSASNRLRVALATLRRLGLRD